ncbi:phage baseplate protein [Providencia rettgeri]
MHEFLKELSFQSQNDANLFNLESFLLSKHFIELALVVNAYGETIDILPLVTRIKENGEPIPNSIIYGVHVHRIHRGDCAIIANPVVGDIGFCIYCDKDSTSAFNSKTEGAPQTSRNHSRMDGIYIGGVVNKQPTHYIELGDEGLTLRSPNPIKMDTPLLEVTGDVLDNSKIQTSTMAAMREKYNKHTHVVSGIESGGASVDSNQTTEVQ